MNGRRAAIGTTSCSSCLGASRLTYDVWKPRLRKSGHWIEGTLDVTKVQGMVSDAIEKVDLDAAKGRGSSITLVDPRAVDVWSKEFFREVAVKIRVG